MTSTRTHSERHEYLVEKQVQVQRWMRILLTGITGQDVAAMSSVQREQLVVVLARLPEEIPAELVAHLRTALAAGEVAA